MKVLMINSVCGIRSTGRICTDIADILKAQGHECKIAYGRETVSDKYKDIAVRIGSNFDVNVHALESRILDNSGFASKRATKSFIEWVKKYDPDVIHLHNIHGYYINIEILFDYLKTCGKKIIWTLHDCWAFTGHCSHFTVAKCEQWKDGCFDCTQLKRYPACFTKGNVQNNYQKKKMLFTNIPNLHIITPSKWLADIVKQSFLKEYPINCIYNGIDLEVFKPSESDFRKKYNLENKKILLGVASVWDDRKGLNDFIELSQILSDDYKIVLVGLNKKQLKDLPGNILGISRTNSTKELAEIYSAADIFLNLTYEDNYPTVNLESQACGTPCITYNTGGSVESVPAENIVEQNDLDGLLHKISQNLDVVVNKSFDKNTTLINYFNEYIT